MKFPCALNSSLEGARKLKFALLRPCTCLTPPPPPLPPLPSPPPPSPPLPQQVMQDNYTVLLEVYEKVLDALRPGSKLCDVYTAALDFLEGKQPELKEHFTRNVG